MCHFAIVLEEASPLLGEQINFYAFNKLARAYQGLANAQPSLQQCMAPDLVRSGKPNSLSDQTLGEENTRSPDKYSERFQSWETRLALSFIRAQRPGILIIILAFQLLISPSHQIKRKTPKPSRNNSVSMTHHCSCLLAQFTCSSAASVFAVVLALSETRPS